MMRANISENNKYWISKDRFYELKHFCLQYPHWKKVYLRLCDGNIHTLKYDEKIQNNNIPNPTEKMAIAKIKLLNKMQIIEESAIESDKELSCYILKAVTEGLSYTNLKTKLDIPCSRDKYYKIIRKFFYILDKKRE